MFCPKCGHSTNDSIAVCRICGAQMTHNQQTPIQAQSAFNNQPQQQTYAQAPYYAQQPVVNTQPVYNAPAYPNNFGVTSNMTGTLGKKGFFTSALLTVATIFLAIISLLYFSMAIRQLELIISWIDQGFTIEPIEYVFRGIYFLWSICLTAGTLGLVISLFASKSSATRGKRPKYAALLIFSIISVIGCTFDLVAAIIAFVEYGYNEWMFTEILPNLFMFVFLILLIVLIAVAKKNGNTKPTSIVCGVFLLLYAFAVFFGNSIMLVDDFQYFSEYFTESYYTLFDTYIIAIYPILSTLSITVCSICYSVLLFKNKK